MKNKIYKHRGSNKRDITNTDQRVGLSVLVILKIECIPKESEIMTFPTCFNGWKRSIVTLLSLVKTFFMENIHFWRKTFIWGLFVHIILVISNKKLRICVSSFSTDACPFFLSSRKEEKKKKKMVQNSSMEKNIF